MKKLVLIFSAIIAIIFSACNLFQSKKEQAQSLFKEFAEVAKSGDVDATTKIVDEIFDFSMANKDEDLNIDEFVQDYIKSFTEQELYIMIKTGVEACRKNLETETNEDKQLKYIDIIYKYSDILDQYSH